MVDRDELELPDMESLRLFMQGTLSSAPQLAGFALLLPDRRYYVATRGKPTEGRSRGRATAAWIGSSSPPPSRPKSYGAK